MSFAVGVLVSGDGSNLQALIDTVHRRDGVEIVAVASNKPDARGLQRAERAGIETGRFPAAEYGGREERDAALGDWLDARGVDLVVLAGFMEILSAGFAGRYAGRMVNVHPSLLPAFPGLRPIEHALEHGVRLMGVTVHFVEEGVDSGPIIAQEGFDPVTYSRDIAAVETRVHEIEHRLLPKVVRLIAAGRVRIDPSNPRHVIVEEADGDH